MKAIIRDAIIALLFSSIIGMTVNSIRSSGIPFIAKESYEIFVPCPEPLGEVEGLSPDDRHIYEEGTLLIDARSNQEFEMWHLKGAMNITFDYLEGVSNEVVKKLASSGAKRIVVYGDGGEPDSGREMARELAGKGIKNVFFVIGGVNALRQIREGE